MSTLKSDSIQPVSNGNNLIFKTGVGDLERMRIQPNGKFVINNARADVGAGSVLTGRGALGTIHFVQNDANDTWVGMTTSSNTTSSTSQGGILIQGSHGYGTKIHFLTTESYAEGQKNRMTLDNFGSLGIGTSTPGASLDVNGTLKVSGEITHGSAPVTVPSGTAPVFGARAWVTFNTLQNSNNADDTTPTNRRIYGSGNVSSVRRMVSGPNGTANLRFKITFTTAMPNANYAVTGMATQYQNTNSTGNILVLHTSTNDAPGTNVPTHKTVDSFDIILANSSNPAANNAGYDNNYVSVVVFG